MNEYDFPKEPKLLQLQEKLDVLIESHKQKCKLYDNAIQNKNIQMSKRLYGESKLVWKSIEEVKKELLEYGSRSS